MISRMVTKHQNHKLSWRFLFSDFFRKENRLETRTDNGITYIPIFFACGTQLRCQSTGAERQIVRNRF